MFSFGGAGTPAIAENDDDEDMEDAREGDDSEITDDSNQEHPAIAGEDGFEPVATMRELNYAESDRVHRRLRSGRYVTVVRHEGDYYCIDSNCYHMGGPLGAGDIEDVKVPCSLGSAASGAAASSSSSSSGGNKSFGSTLGGLAGSLFSGGGANESEQAASGARSAAATSSAASNMTAGAGAPCSLPATTRNDATILCPWHYHRISLTTGRKYTESVKPVKDPATGAMQMKRCGLQESSAIFQQVHEVRIIQLRQSQQSAIGNKNDFDDAWVCVRETPDGAASTSMLSTAASSIMGAFGVGRGKAPAVVVKENPYAFDEQCAVNLTASKPAQVHSRSGHVFQQGQMEGGEASTWEGGEQLRAEPPPHTQQQSATSGLGPVSAGVRLGISSAAPSRGGSGRLLVPRGPGARGGDLRPPFTGGTSSSTGPGPGSNKLPRVPGFFASPAAETSRNAEEGGPGYSFTSTSGAGRSGASSVSEMQEIGESDESVEDPVFQSLRDTSARMDIADDRRSVSDSSKNAATPVESRSILERTDSKNKRHIDHPSATGGAPPGSEYVQLSTKRPKI
mmetsp:Transcript_4961/g.12435  ORF Transcript_4961/g.12435 Transcript_4961/m.12435 type:complete len:566 (+) Transcript_4961:121-1818(+)